MPTQNRLQSFLYGQRIIQSRKGEMVNTHTSMPGTTKEGKKLHGGSFSIDTPEKETKLFKLYCYEVAKGNKVCLTELHREYSPMKIDLDFRFDVPEDKNLVRAYSLDDVKWILRVFWEEFD